MNPYLTAAKSIAESKATFCCEALGWNRDLTKEFAEWFFPEEIEQPDMAWWTQHERDARVLALCFMFHIDKEKMI